jgi:hypothetical protein
MITNRSEEQVERLHQRIEQLEVRANAGATAARQRIQHHLDPLRRAEIDVRIALRTAPEQMEGRLAQLHSRLEVARHSVTAELAPDVGAYTRAVEAELDSWDVFFERLQTTAATNAWNRRLHAEAAISEMRALRLDVQRRLAALRASPADVWQGHRAHVTTARERLERIVDEYSAQSSQAERN